MTRMRISKALVCLLLMLSTVPALAVGRVEVLALFPDKAMLNIDGKNRLLRKGQESPEGVKLIAANPNLATVFVDGERREMTLGTTVRSSYQRAEKREVRILRSNAGSYLTPGAINGRAVNFLVDTGASSVAMSEVEARRLGIPFQLEGQPMQVITASGAASAHRVTLDKITIGEIELTDVEGVVIDGDSPASVLLGMSFLNHLQIENLGNVMVLRKKY